MFHTFCTARAPTALKADLEACWMGPLELEKTASTWVCHLRLMCVLQGMNGLCLKEILQPLWGSQRFHVSGTPRASKGLGQKEKESEDNLEPSATLQEQVNY